MKKGIFVKEIVNECAVEGVFYVVDRRLANTKEGKPYLALVLMDKTGQIEAKIWDDATSVANICKKDSFVFVTGFSKAYNGSLQLTIRTVSAVNATEMDPSDFIPAADVDVRALWLEMSGYITAISDPTLSRILSTMFSDEALVDAYCRAPGAKRLHHAYLHGLLVHTLQMLRVADAICNLYPTLKRDLLLAGVILHDLGKIFEYDFSRPGFSRTDEGKLVGHLNLAISMIDETARRAGLDPHLPVLVALKHLILSHHGRHEYGSPVLPMTREAFVLHFIDEIDAKINYLDVLRSELKDAEETWSGYQAMYGRAFHLPH